MFIKFSTKVDKNGNKYYLAVDTVNSIYSREPFSWYRCTDPDIIVIDKKQRRKLIDELENAGFQETYNPM